MKNNIIAFLILIVITAKMTGAQNAPITTAGTLMSNDPVMTIPVTAQNFINVASCNLRLSYDPAIVTATLVSQGPSLPGSLSYNVTSTPGIVVWGWYYSSNVTLPDNSVVFYITFTRVAPGFSALTWEDNGNSCKFSNENSVVLNDIPYSNYYVSGLVTFLSPDAPHTAAPNVTACPGTLVSVPVTVSEFDHIGSVSLLMQYNSSVLTYQSGTVNPDFPDLAVSGTAPGTINVNGLAPSGGTGITLPDNTVLFTLFFNYIGGSTILGWYDNGTSCQYSGLPPALTILNDIPQVSFYTNGSVGPENPSLCDKTLDITVFLQGLYLGNGLMREASNGSGSNFGDGIADKISVELHDAANYNTVVHSVTNLDLGTDGTVSALVPPIYNGAYYITIRHRNSIPVVSGLPVSFSGNVINYNFTDQASNAYGDNMVQMSDGKWALYAGDVNQDNIVDSDDMIIVDNFASTFSTGYLPADCNGDGLIDSSDMVILDNNSADFIASAFP